MIIKFKLFESSTANELIDYIDDNYIEEYFDTNYSIDVNEIIELWPKSILNHIDDESFMKNFISDEINNRSLEDFSDWDLSDYIKKHLTDVKEAKIIELYKSNNGMDDDEITSDIDGKISFIRNKKLEIKKIVVTSKEGVIKKYKVSKDSTILVQENDYITKDTIIAKNEELDYNESMLKDLSDDDLREVIEEDNEADNFIEEITNNNYSGYDAEDIIKEFYGDIEKMSGKELNNVLDWLRNYIDEDEIVKEYMDEQEIEYKKEFTEERIHDDEILQKYILDNNGNKPEVIILLADLFESEPDDNNLSGEYDFQKKYIDAYVEENTDGKDMEELKSVAMKYLYDNFDLNSDISEEYKEYMWLIDADKYNL